MLCPRRRENAATLSRLSSAIVQLAFAVLPLRLGFFENTSGALARSSQLDCRKSAQSRKPPQARRPPRRKMQSNGVSATFPVDLPLVTIQRPEESTTTA